MSLNLRNFYLDIDSALVKGRLGQDQSVANWQAPVYNDAGRGDFRLAGQNHNPFAGDLDQGLGVKLIDILRW